MRKRYLGCCAACGRLFPCSRTDARTCSDSCRKALFDHPQQMRLPHPVAVEDADVAALRVLSRTVKVERAREAKDRAEAKRLRTAKALRERRRKDPTRRAHLEEKIALRVFDIDPMEDLPTVKGTSRTRDRRGRFTRDNPAEWEWMDEVEPPK